MIVLALEITLYLPFAHSLKEKRKEIKSLIDKVKNKFNVSIAEVDHMDHIQSALLGVAVVSNSNQHAQQTMDKVIVFIESNTQGEVTQIHR